MAADALIRLDRKDIVDRWVDDYMLKLDDAPRPRYKIDGTEWRGLLGDASRLGDWIAFFNEQTRNEPWTDLLATWWPRLIPASIASATHCMIRTGHAVRALTEGETPQRLGELAQALGYWAGRWQSAPQPARPAGTMPADRALEELPALETGAGYRTLVADIAEHPGWGASVQQLAPVTSPAEVPAALEALVDAAVTRYSGWAHRSPVMLVHIATAPRAVALVVPELPKDLWLDSYQAAWTASATMGTAYRPAEPETVDVSRDLDPDSIIDRATGTADDHAIKFTEVAMESHARGNPNALTAIDQAATLIGNNT